MLIDDVTITVKAGNGGDGSLHFLRNAQTRRGGPDGGNGGNGGNVYMQGVDDILGLAQFQFKKEWKAEDGKAGSKKNLYGRNGRHVTIPVPLGTALVDLYTGEQWEITNRIDSICIARGGKGGRGNKEFATAIDRTPRYAEKGTPGQERTLRLVLKIIADVGFIGLPNAGKSSLLTVLTNAKPKIGDYPFTTLEPNVGVLSLGVNVNNLPGEQKVILADIPGLIEGASKGKGLGIQFLQHVEKTKMLVHCIDSTSENPLKDYQTVKKELKAYSKILAEKEEVIVLTKTDLIDTESRKEKIRMLQTLGRKIFPISIYNEECLQNLCATLQLRNA